MTKLFAYFQTLEATLRDREEGQTLVEYSLILVLISIVSIGLMTILGTSIGAVWTEVTTALG